MKKMKKILALALAASVLSASFFGCKNDDDGSLPPVTPETPVSKIAMNGKAFDTIAAAIAAIPTSGDTGTYKIVLQPGTYNENGLSYKGAASIVISGNTTTKYGADVIIAGQGKDQTSTRTRPLFEMDGTGNLILENVTLKNTFARATATTKDTQAEALGHDSTGTVAAYNCSFLSHQDTIRTVSKSWFYGCYIEGDVDFLWCEASSKVALYEKCEIKAVGDEADAAYIVAPKTNKDNKVWKGLVVFNSSVATENKETYLFRNPWSSDPKNPDAYKNAAFINVDISESGEGKINPKLLKSVAVGTDDQKYVGWKVDETIAGNYPSKDATIGTVDAALAAAEYAGRNNIINRVYNVASAKFAQDAESKWDVNALAQAQGWTVEADTSKDLLDGETETKITVYDLTQETVDGIIFNGFDFKIGGNGKPYYVGKAEDTITVPVAKNSIVTVYGCYKANANIKAGEQGEKVYICTNGSTSAETYENYIVYSAPCDVVITANAESWLTKIVVEEDETLEYVPATAVDVSCEKEKFTAGVKAQVKADVSPATATNRQVKWSSSDAAVATVDEATGTVTPLAAGTVTITATARDGSGVTAAKTFEVEEATWTKAEWYSTGTNSIVAAGADNGAFSTGSSSGKSLGATVSFTNLAGETVSTGGGLKLNSSGKMEVATTASGYLTLITYEGTGAVAQPGVNGAEGGTATLISKTGPDSGKLTTYVFVLSAADTYTIDRSPATSEINPIVYARVELCPTAWDDADFESDDNIQGKVGTWKSLVVDATASTGKFVDNGDSWIQCNTGTIVYIPVKADATIVIQGYEADYAITGGTDTALTDNGDNTYTYNFAYADAVTVDGYDGKYAKVTMGSNGYWGDITLTYAEVK